jgi:hypothetical protein
VKNPPISWGIAQAGASAKAIARLDFAPGQA